MKSISALIYDRKGGVMDIRAKGLLSPLKGEFKISYYYKEKRGFLSNFFCFLKYVKTIADERPNIIYAVDIGPATIILLFILRVLRLSFNILIDIGDMAYELKNKLGKNFLEQQAFRWSEWYLLNKADGIIVRGRLHKELLEKRNYKNIYFLPDGVDTDVLKPYSNDDFRKEMGLRNTFTIGLISTLAYFKKLNYYQGWDLIEVAKLLKNENMKVIIIGDGTALTYLKLKTREYDLEDKILFLGRIPFNNIPKYLSLIDVMILTKIGDITAEITTTGKLPLSLACGCYILANRVGEAKFVLPEEMLLPYKGIKDSDYPKLLAERIKGIINNKSLLNLRMKGRKIAEEKYSYKFLAKSFRDIIAHL